MHISDSSGTTRRREIGAKENHKEINTSDRKHSTLPPIINLVFSLIPHSLKVTMMEKRRETEPLVNIVNVNVLDNPTTATNPFQFEIIFESYTNLDEGTSVVREYSCQTWNGE